MNIIMTQTQLQRLDPECGLIAIDTMLNFDVNIDEDNTKRFTGMDMVYLVLLSTDITDIGNAHQLHFCIIMIINSV